ncbi:MAG: ABC transporter permease [Oscillospiraceae bacterium]|nr:ABC transporter permease [Oscillospiraceae bacterium]
MNEVKTKNAMVFIKALNGVRDPAFALITAIVIVAVIIAAMGYDPLNAYRALFTSSVSSLSGWGETLQKSTLLIFTALSFAIAKKCGMINLGASGQLYMGGIAGMLVATTFEGLFSPIHIILVLLAGIAAGAVFGAIVALLKNLFGASEVVTSMMLNYVGDFFCTYLISGPMRGAGTDLAQSAPALESARLPILISGTRLHAGLLIAIAAIILYYFLMEHTTRGYQMKVVGMNPSAGAYAGMKIKTNQLIAMAIAGGLAGLGGAIQATVINVRLTIDWAGNYGFDGLAVAFVGGMAPIGIAVASVLFGILLSGADKMQMLAGVPSSVIYLFQGIVILIIIGRELFEKFDIKTLREKHMAKIQNEKNLSAEKIIILNDASDRIPGKFVPSEAEKAAANANYTAKQISAAKAVVAKLLADKEAYEKAAANGDEGSMIMAKLTARQADDITKAAERMISERAAFEKASIQKGGEA